MLNRSAIASTFKSPDTEEFIDIYFYRPVGYYWALLFRKLGVSPHSVTVLSIIIGMAGGICFYYQSLAVNIGGMGLLVWANMYDSADGQLARMTGKTSPVGRILDGICGDLWFITVYAALCLRLTPQWGIWIWLLGAVTGFFHIRQAAIADYYRNVHLLFLKGEAGSELSHTATLKKKNEQLDRKRDFIAKLFQTIYLQYTGNQERMTPQLQRMMKVIRDRHRNEAPESFRTAFRKKSLPLMKYTNILSFNTRAIALFISLFIGMPWLYFAFELTALNVVFVYMIVTHERFCAGFCKRLESQNV
jgi:hypothetical protein